MSKVVIDFVDTNRSPISVEVETDQDVWREGKELVVAVEDRTFYLNFDHVLGYTIIPIP